MLFWLYLTGIFPMHKPHLKTLRGHSNIQRSRRVLWKLGTWKELEHLVTRSKDTQVLRLLRGQSHLSVWTLKAFGHMGTWALIFGLQKTLVVLGRYILFLGHNIQYNYLHRACKNQYVSHYDKRTFTGDQILQ